jgi:RND family efflux transporter MFP subunit
MADSSIQLQTNQVKSLGVTTKKINELESARMSKLSALVQVPTAQMRVIAAPVSGLVEMMSVAPGSLVKRGQVLAQLASPVALELQREQVQANASAQLQQQNLTRDEQLFSEGLIAESRLQATRAAAKIADTQARERKKSLSLAGISDIKLGGALRLTAPIDGVILEQGTQLGQRVEAATLIYRLAKLSPLWLETQAPIELAKRWKEGMTVKISGRDVSGKVISIGRSVDAASQTVLMRALVSEGAEQLNPGQIVQVEVIESNISGSIERPIALPFSALFRHQGKTMVFVRTTINDKGSTFSQREVSVVKQGGESVWVEGLDSGDSIVITGTSALKSILNTIPTTTGAQ